MITVFFFYWDQALKNFRNNSYVNIKSIRDFWMKTQYPGGKSKVKRKFKKSSFRNKDEIIYLKFHAKIIVLNLGEFDWHIPWIYCNIDKNNTDTYKYCTRKFKNTLLFADVLDFVFYSDYIKRKQENSNR